MKKRVLSFVLAALMIATVPAETAFAMPVAEKVVTLTEEPGAETTEDEETVVEATEAPVVEASEEPVVEESEAPTAEATDEPIAEPTQVPEETPEATKEPTVAATEEPEATEEPTQTPEATEEPTQTPEATEEPVATPSASPEKQDIRLEGRDLTAKVVGSNGVQYDNVAYLSLQAVSSLSADKANAYTEMCDTIANTIESGLEIESAVISLNNKRELELVITMSNQVFSSEEIQKQFMDGESADLTEEEETEEAEEEAAVEEAVVEEVEAAVAEDVTGSAEKAEIFGEITAQTAESQDSVISENVELANALAVPEEVFGEVTAAEFDTKLANSNYFKNQLNSEEKKIYDLAKKAVVSDGKNSFSYKGPYMVSAAPMANAISAVINTYPNSFNWMKPGGSTKFGGIYAGGGKYKYTITIEKSKHYKATLETQAKNKVRTLVAEANKYATANYPGNHVYGVITYLDNWVCANNYYNNVGTSENTSTQNTDVFFYCHSCYGILLKGYGVCESYALAMTRLLDAAGIRNLYVTGDGGGPHAWNQVQMPNGSWYLLDSTWNDNGSSSSKAWTLIGSGTDAGQHKGYGKAYDGYGLKSFKFYSLAAGNYNSNTEKTYINSVTLNKTSAALKVGSSVQLRATLPSGTSNYYWSKYAKSWSSSNTAVATVSKSGKVTAKKPGTATISYVVDGVKKSCNVYVYSFKNLTFANNNRTSYSYTYADKDRAFTASDAYTVQINVNQNSRWTSAANIKNVAGLNNPTVKSSNAKVASATATLSNDAIILTVTPKKIGNATITVTFAGKKATYKVTNKYQMQSGWFNALPYSTKEYTGAAFKPAVSKSASAPKGLTYSVSYKNNVNAGTATVTIKGTGSYTGTVTRTFSITRKNIAATGKFISCTAAKTYNGKAQKATTVVKVGGKTLSAGKDYTVTYNNSTTAPTNIGTYTVKITGTGNYTGAIATVKTFKINPISISKVTTSCSTSVKYKGTAVAPTVTVKIGSTKLRAGVDYNVSYRDANGIAISASSLVNKGSYKAVISPKGSNINWGTKKEIVKNFKIVK